MTDYYDVDSDDTTLACPACDRAAIVLNSTGDNDCPRYRCAQCGHQTDEPAQRVIGRPRGRRGLAGDLENADPAEVFGDE